MNFNENYENQNENKNPGGEQIENPNGNTDFSAESATENNDSYESSPAFKNEIPSQAEYEAPSEKPHGNSHDDDPRFYSPMELKKNSSENPPSQSQQAPHNYYDGHINAPQVNTQNQSAGAGNAHQRTTSGISYNRTPGGDYSWGYNTPSQNFQQPRRKKSGNGLAVFTAIICVAFLITATALTVTLISGKTHDVINGDDSVIVGNEQNADNKTSSDSNASIGILPGTGNNANGDSRPVIQQGDAAPEGQLSIAQIADKCKPSSVGIEVIVNNGFFTTSGVGSGFIISEDGYIATNNHVIENAASIKVLLDDKREFDAELIGRDAVTDLAVIKIDAQNLPVAELGNSDNVKVGDLAIAIGTPAGIEFAGTVTDGIISAINRDVEITNNYGQVVKTMTLIQTNATINPGNSGGPLINAKGQVIGINTLKLTSQYEGIGFSIPINSAVSIFNQLIEHGEVTERDGSFVTGQGSIGITDYAEITPREAQYYDIPQGLLVIQINRNSSAAAAGLSRGDIIVAFEGTPVKTAAEINKLKADYKAGDEVTITVHRDRVGEFDITFKLDMMEA